MLQSQKRIYFQNMILTICSHQTKGHRKEVRGTEKKLSELTEREILRQQFELLAETSKNTANTYGMDLSKLTEAMILLYDRLV